MTEPINSADEEVFRMSSLQRIRRDLIDSRTANSEASQGSRWQAAVRRRSNQGGKIVAKKKLVEAMQIGRDFRNEDDARDHLCATVDD
jgi:hypothetical protein